MKNQVRFVCLALSLSFFFNSVSFANAVFKMTATRNILEVGETATIGLWANIEEQTTGLNGINLWQLDMVVDVGNVVTVVDVSLIAPSPRDTFMPEYVGINTPDSGNLLGVGASVFEAPKDSGVGVGEFSLLANITIQAIGLGEVTYSLGGDTLGFNAYLRDFDWGNWQDPSGTSVYDSTYAAPYRAVFQSGNNVFTVVPEPGSLAIMAVMAGFALRRRRVSIRK